MLLYRTGTAQVILVQIFRASLACHEFSSGCGPGATCLMAHHCLEYTIKRKGKTRAPLDSNSRHSKDYVQLYHERQYGSIGEDDRFEGTGLDVLYTRITRKY